MEKVSDTEVLVNAGRTPGGVNNHELAARVGRLRLARGAGGIELRCDVDPALPEDLRRRLLKR